MFLDPRVTRVRFTYTNHRGEVREREAVGPFEIVYDRSDRHHGRQWLLCCFDPEKGSGRTFAMKNMTDVREADEEDVLGLLTDSGEGGDR